MTPPPSVIQQLIQFGVVPVIRTAKAKTALTAVEWLREAGYRTFEITLTIPDAAAVIHELSAASDLLIGAGTAFTADDVERVVAAGACYVVSPCVVAEVAQACRNAHVPCLMGALTPTEVRQAVDCGAAVVKIFPASTVGTGHLKALRSVFPGVAFMPTGGVDAATVGDWLKAGAACVGVGGKLVDETLIGRGDKAAVIAAGRQLLDAFQGAR